MNESHKVVPSIGDEGLAHSLDFPDRFYHLIGLSGCGLYKYAGVRSLLPFLLALNLGHGFREDDPRETIDFQDSLPKFRRVGCLNIYSYIITPQNGEGALHATNLMKSIHDFFVLSLLCAN